MDNKKIASELVKIAKELSASDLTKVYNEQNKQIQSLIVSLKESLKKHKDDFENKDKDDWGYAGDLGKVREDLKEIVSFLS